MRKLQQIGNTVIVVEHDEEIMLASDYIVDIGKDAGRLGGNLIYQGNLKDAIDKMRKLTHIPSNTYEVFDRLIILLYDALGRNI